MTYEELVHDVRVAFENADARQVFEHIAVQINIVGEGAGIMYIEVADRHISVEPYDYYDHDGLVTIDGLTIKDIASGKLTFHDAYESGRLQFQGNLEKVRKISSIQSTVKKSRAKKTK